jgi:hypothetical protein
MEGPGGSGGQQSIVKDNSHSCGAPMRSVPPRGSGWVKVLSIANLPNADWLYRQKPIGN